MKQSSKQAVVGYISPTDPFKDKNGWSGTYYSTRKAIEDAGYRVVWISSTNRNRFSTLIYKIFGKLYSLLFHAQFANTAFSSKIRASYVNKQNLDKYDLIYTPGQSDVTAGLKTKTPIIRYSDATVARMIDYYWFNWSEKAISNANMIEQRAISNASINLLASHWAAESVVKDYGAPEDRVFVLPLGANIEPDTKVASKAYEGGQLNILFSGVDWKRKGGQIAIDTVRKLREDGYQAKLYICGIKNLDSKVANLEYVENLGFLNKNNPDEYQKYLDAWANSHMLLLPTRAECAGIVFNEASAYGVPSLATDTGGIADYVYNDVNGYRMPLSASGAEYAAKIEEWIKEDRFKELSEGAKKVYHDTNSWEAWGRKFRKIADSLIANK